MQNIKLETSDSVGTNGMGFFNRVLGVIISPSETMRELINRPMVLFPVIAMVVTLPALYLARFQLYKELVKYLAEAGIAEKSSQMTAEQIEAARTFMEYTPIIGLFSTPVNVIIYWLIFTTAIFAFVKVFKGEGRYKQYLSITGYAFVITILSTVITAIVSFFTGSLIFDSSLANITNIFAPDLKGSYVYGIIRGIDLFKVWEYAVVSIGVLMVSKLDKAKVYSILSVIFVVSLLIGAGSIKYM